MRDDIRGPLRSVVITEGSGAGGDITCYICPEEGDLWELYQVRATHDDAAGLTCQWRTVDIDTPTDTLIFQATAVPRYLFTDCPGMRGGIRLNRNCYLSFKVSGMAAAKTITCVVLYEHIRVGSEWVGR